MAGSRTGLTRASRARAGRPSQGGSPSMRLLVVLTMVGGATALLAAPAWAGKGPKKPGKPTGVTATAGNASATVSWTAPVDDGGSPVTGYVATSKPGGITCSTTGATTCTVSPLVDGRSYTFTVVAENVVGTSPKSATSLPVVPYDQADEPGAPTGVSALAFPGGAQVWATQPASSGNGYFVGYDLVATNVTAGTSSEQYEADPLIPISVEGLTIGDTYTFTLMAVNSHELVGPPSAPSNPVVPIADVPGSPQNVTAVGGNGTITVSFAPPSDDGGAPVTSYTAEISEYLNYGEVTVTGASSPIVVPAVNGDDYVNVGVAATNSTGTGDVGWTSNGVIPEPGPVYGIGTDPSGIVSDGTDLWVRSNFGQSANEIDPSTGAVLRSVSVANPDAIAADSTDVWVQSNQYGQATGLNNAIYEIDASTGAVVSTILVPGDSGFGGMSDDGTHVWSGNSDLDSLTEIDAATGDVVQTIPLGTVPEAVSSDGTDVWVGDDSGHVLELDAATGALVRTVDTGTGTNIWDVDSDGTDVWASLPGADEVVEIDAATGAIVNDIPVGADPTILSSDGTHVFVVNSYDPVTTVSEISCATGTVVQTYTVGGGTDDSVYSDGTHAWVGVYNDDVLTALTP